MYVGKFSTNARTKAQAADTATAPASKAKGTSSKAAPTKSAAAKDEDEDLEIEEEHWLTEKIEDAKDVAVAVVAAIPGPRVGSTGAPWLLVVPAAYLGLTFILAVVKTIQKINSPRAKRQRQVNKNAGLMESLDELLDPASPGLSAKEFRALEKKFGFGADEVLRKYIRYTLNEKPFGPQVVGGLIRLRQASRLPDESVAEVLNEVSRRTVKAKGPVVMETTGFTEKGLQRKVAVQALFSKLLYLSELEDFCSQSVRDKLQVKSVFGVTDEDADSIRIVSLSSAEDMDKLDRALRADRDTEETAEGSASSQED